MSIISCVDVHDMCMYCTYLYAGTVTLIDYEYVGVNYPAFDIGSFFCEFGGNNPNICTAKLSLHSVSVFT